MNSPLKNNNKQRDLIESDLEEMHHNLMECYGWIPIDEFKKIPLPMLFNLHNHVMIQKNKNENLRLTILKFCGVKNPK